jgi:peptide/nickel transport system substrate-binding protein
MRIPQKRLWLASLVTLALFLTTACTGSGSTPPKPAAPGAQPTPGGTLTYAFSSSFVDNLDPHVTSQTITHLLMSAIFDPLVFWGPDGNFYPGLAEKWGSSADGKTWTFTLKPGVKFHDGTPVDSEAVKFSFDRMVDPNTKSRQAGVALKDYYEKTEVVDARNFKIILKKPKASFLNTISQAFFAPVSPKAVKELGEEFGRKPVGAGPFKFVEWVQNQHIKVTRNPDYNWGPPFLHPGQAYLENIIFRQVADPGARMAALESGQVDIAQDPPLVQWDRLAADPRFQVVKVAQPGQGYGWPINVKKAPTDDLKVRQAMIFSVDRVALTKNVHRGVFSPAYGILTPASFGYNPAVEKMYPYDPKKADQLLDEAGWMKGADGMRAKNGLPLVIEHWVFTSTAEAEFVQAEWKKVGIKSNITLQDVGAVNQAATEGVKNNLAPLPFTHPDPEVLSTTLHSRNVGKGFSWTFHNLKQLDDLLDAAEVELDPAKRAEIYGKVQVVVNENALWLPSHVRETLRAAKKEVQGIKFNRRGYDEYFHDIWIKK